MPINFTVNWDELTNDVDDTTGDIGTVAAVGVVKLIPQFADGARALAPDYSPRPTSFPLRTFEGYLDSDGRLKNKAGGTPGMRVWANDPVFNLVTLPYRVEADLTDLLGRRIPWLPFTFEAPATDTPINLVTVMPVPGGPVGLGVTQGPRGYGITGAYLDTVASQAEMIALVGAVGDWVIRSDTGTIWVVTATPTSSAGNWVELEYPSVNAIPSTGITDSTPVGRAVLTAGDAAAARTVISAAFTTDVTTSLAGKQPLDADLTAVAGLTPTNDDVVQRKAGAWTNRTPAQLKTDLVLTKSDVGLPNADNTSDVNKPVSTATAAALALKAPLTTVYMPVPSGDTTGATDTANLVAAQASLLSGIAGSIIFAPGIYWVTKDRTISAYQHWFGQGNGGDGGTTIKLAASQSGNLLTTANYNTWRTTDGSTAVSATKTVTSTSGSAVVTLADSTGVNVGDLISCTGFQLGVWVTAKTSTTITLSQKALSSATSSASFSSIPIGWGLHNLTLDGFGRFTGLNNANRLDPPTAPTVTATGTTGSTIYSYRVTAVNAVGETQVSPPTRITNGNATLTGSNYNAISWSAVTGATSYKIYKTKASRFWPQATLDTATFDEGYLATVTGTTSYNDTGAATPGWWGPAQNSTAGRVLGVYSWNYVLENVDIAGGAGLGWEADAPGATATNVFASSREFNVRLHNVCVRDNRYGGAKVLGPTDGFWTGADFVANGNAGDATTNWLANLSLEAPGWQVTNYHIYGGGVQIGCRTLGLKNYFVNGQNEDGYINWLIHGNYTTIDSCASYTTAVGNTVSAFYVNSYGNKITSDVFETGAGILTLGPDAGYNDFDLNCGFSTNTPPSPPYTGYADLQTKLRMRVTDSGLSIVVLLDQASRNITAKTGTTYTLGLTDSGTVTMSNASASTLTVPTNATAQFPIGHLIRIIQLGAGQVTVAAAGGVTVTGTPGLKLRAQNSVANLQKLDTNTWALGGDLSA